MGWKGRWRHALCDDHILFWRPFFCCLQLSILSSFGVRISKLVLDWILLRNPQYHPDFQHYFLSRTPAMCRHLVNIFSPIDVNALLGSIHLKAHCHLSLSLRSSSSPSLYLILYWFWLFIGPLISARSTAIIIFNFKTFFFYFFSSRLIIITITCRRCRSRSRC